MRETCCKLRFREAVLDRLARLLGGQSAANAKIDAILELIVEPNQGAGRLIPHITIEEFDGPVTKTPQFQSTFKGEVIAMFDLKDTQEITLRISGKDKHGHDAAVENVEWFVDSTEMLSATPAADGMSCKFRPVGPLGQAIVSVKCDGNIGDGESTLSGSFELNVIAGDAVNIDITPDTPVDIEE